METKPDKAEEEIAAVRSAATADGDSSPVKENQDGEMPLSGHLQEFRSRLIICLAAVAVASGVSYNFVGNHRYYIGSGRQAVFSQSGRSLFFVYSGSRVYGYIGDAADYLL